MRTAPILALAFGLSLALAAAAGAQSGTQLTPDGKRALVSKDIGGQRWAISRNPDHTATGNVFFPGGGAPQFVFCTESSASGSEVTLSCSGADACPLSTCAPSEWLFIAEVTLPLSFFGSPTGAPARTATQATGARPSATKAFVDVGRAAAASGAGQAAGIQITPNGSLALISKDVGDQRWAITRNDDGTVTGNVFFPGGGAPQFVWCEPTGTATDPVPLRCLGAAACGAGEGGCASSDWTLIAEVSLPASFFRARDTVSLQAVTDELGAQLGENAAFDAVALALDRGYSLRQIVRAALGKRLLASGQIGQRAGGFEAPAGPPLGLFTASTAALQARPLELNVTLDQLRARFGEQAGIDALYIILFLIDDGYPLDQIIEEIFFGTATIVISDSAAFSLQDENRKRIPPRSAPAGVGAPPAAPAACGNGVREPGEGCDGSDFGVTTCDTLQLPSGTLRCNADCTLDASECRGFCGDGRRFSGTESCDGNDLAGESCSTLGFGGGVLRCSLQCFFDTTQCTACALGGSSCCTAGTKPCNGACVPEATVCCAPGTEQCGDGCIPSGADCCGAGGSFCEVGRICVDAGCCPAGFPVVCGDQCYAAGTSCCGNGNLDPGEACDGADVGGATCPELGSVRCTSSCTLDTSGCEAKCPAGAFTCGNSCAPDGAECCEGTSRFCDGGDTCAGDVCCPAGFPTYCASKCYPSGVVCCGSYACAAGSTCLGNDQCS